MLHHRQARAASSHSLSPSATGSDLLDPLRFQGDRYRAMDFLFAMSVFSSAADGAYEKGKAQEWMRAWVDRGDDGAAPPRGKPRQRQDEPPASQGRKKEEWLQQRRRGFAPEFDGLNYFETFVAH